MTEPLPEIARLGIGKVLEELHEEFPTLTISKIRFLESEGLLEPERTASGYRKFSFADIERLRFVLRQQAAPYFWPLSHIRQVLDEMDRGEVPATLVGPVTRVPDIGLDADGLPTTATFTHKRSQLRLTREDLVESSGIEESDLDEIEDYGLIRRRPTQTYYDGTDLQIASLVAQFAELGLGPRHLRQFATTADREAGVFDQVVSPRSRRDDADAATETIGALAALSVRLHTVLLRDRLHR